jgi:hypothetical protein
MCFWLFENNWPETSTNTRCLLFENPCGPKADSKMPMSNRFRVHGIGSSQKTKSMVLAALIVLLVNIFTPLGEVSWKARNEEFYLCASFSVSF